MTASTTMAGAAQRDAFGKSGRHSVSIPKVPTLSSTPTKSTDVPAGAFCAASGSHVCTGNIGALIAYTSVSHFGFIVLGIFAFSSVSVEGSSFYMFNHGLSTGGLFLLAGMMARRD